MDFQHVAAAQVEVAFSTNILAWQYLMLALPDFCQVLDYPACPLIDGLSYLCGVSVFWRVNLYDAIGMDVYGNFSPPLFFSWWQIDHLIVEFIVPISAFQLAHGLRHPVLPGQGV